MTKIFPHCTISVGLAPLADKNYAMEKKSKTNFFRFRNIFTSPGAYIRTRQCCIKFVIAQIYPSRDIPEFVMYCVYGESAAGSSLIIIESTNTMI